MSSPPAQDDSIFEEEVVSSTKLAASPLHLKNTSVGSPPAMNWSDSSIPPPNVLLEAPFHISHTSEPSFKPLIPENSLSTSTSTSAPTTSSNDVNASSSSTSTNTPDSGKLKSADSTTGKPRASITPRVAVGGVPFGVESLLKAVKSKSADSVATLLKQGMNPNAQNEENQTALHLAVLAQSPAIVKILLECPVLDPNMFDIAYNTPLHIASVHADPAVRCSPDLSELVPALPSSQSPQAESSAQTSETPTTSSPTMLVPAASLMDATGENDSPMESIVRLLCMDPRTDVNIRNASLHVPLIYSCLNGNYKVAALLVRAGASVNAATHTDIYPLHAACENGYADIVRLLLLNGALVNVRDYQGYTPLHLAARGNFGAICSLLWRHRADINAVTVSSPSNPVGKRPSDLSTDPEIKNFLSGMRTSSSHPLEINFVTHNVLGKSRIGMTMCPGRNKKNHRRNLRMDIATLLQVGTQVLVTLVQQHELDSMKIPDMMTQVRAAGIEVIHAPIKDKWIPSRVGILVELVDLIAARVKVGRCITVHCNGGKGRTGLVVAATLVALGMEPGPATDLIRTVRPGMLYNPAQIVYLRLYQRTITGREGPVVNPTSPPTELAVFEPQSSSPPVETQPQEDACAACEEDEEDEEPKTKPSENGATSSATQDTGDVPPTILSPAPPSQVDLTGIQIAANEQEKQGQPDLPVGEQHSFTVGTLIDLDSSKTPTPNPPGLSTPTESLI